MRGLSPGSRTRLLVAAAAVIALAVASVLLLSESTPPQGRALVSMFEDDALLVDQPLSPAGDATVARTLKAIKSLGADRLRIIMQWKQVAPGGQPYAGGATAPPNFNGADPAAYGNGWAAFDRVDRLARADGLAVDFDVTPMAPLWATQPLPHGAKASYASVYEPSAPGFEKFVRAAGERYGGRYRPPGQSSPLPRVSFWSAGNEPNQPGWLSPQQSTARGPDLAPAMYRLLVDAYWQGLIASGHTPKTDTIVIGELAPQGCTPGSACAFGPGYRAIPPLKFLREMYCLSASYEPLRGTAATAVDCPAKPAPAGFVKTNPGLFDASGFSEHPYDFTGPPTQTLSLSQDADFVPISELGHLEQALDRAQSAYGSRRSLPLYLTEYGYETDPPKPGVPVTPAQQATYLDEATWMAARDARVRALGQFELQDSTRQPGGWFPEGLEFVNAKPKPAFAAYRIPIWIAQPNLPAGGSTEVWGMLRAAPNDTTQTAVVQWRPAGGHAYKDLAATTTRDPSGFIDQRISPPASGLVRIRWTAPDAKQYYSRAAPVSVR